MGSIAEIDGFNSAKSGGFNQAKFCIFDMKQGLSLSVYLSIKAISDDVASHDISDSASINSSIVRMLNFSFEIAIMVYLRRIPGYY